MDVKTYLKILNIAGRLKDTPRHCYTVKGRVESVAEHSWKLALMAALLKDEFPGLDETKLLKMCLIHDLGEAFTGDIPTFNKNNSDEDAEERLLNKWLDTFPEEYQQEFKALFIEMKERKTLEARVFKALDGLEALIQHNESDLDTWSANEYELNLHYCDDRVDFSPFLKDLREVIREETIKKIDENK